MVHYTKPPLVTLIGPTASGKTRLAVSLASLFSGEIISADSRQVYRFMDIGTGKDLAEYGDIPYHLIDIVEPHQEFDLFSYAEGFCSSYNRIINRDKLPFLVGGTGMYLDAVLSRYKLTIANIDENTRSLLEKKSDEALRQLLVELKPAQHNTTDTEDRGRLIRAIEIELASQHSSECLAWPNFEPFIIGIRVPRNVLKGKINARLKARFQEGMIDEVEMLIRRGISDLRLHNFGLEYRYIALYLKGELNYNDMFQKLNAEIVRFSKQQEKWFRTLEKKQHKIHWLEANHDLESQATLLLEEHLRHITRS